VTETPRTDSRKALRIRQRVKACKPTFERPESWRYMRLKTNWRRPRGLDHKMRRKIKGWPATVSTGYRGPRIARDLHPSGYREVLVNTIDELRDLDPKAQVIRIAHTVGRRKRTRIITEARKKKLRILNARQTKEVPKEKLPAEDLKSDEFAEKEKHADKKEEKSSDSSRKTRRTKEPAKK
jgi:large subunit ribosomal protein L32e